MEIRAEKKRIAAVEGWFTMDEKKPRLIGTRCKSCGDYFFPRAVNCRNPLCRAQEVEEVFLSRRGRIWSYTVNYYQPPAPYVPPDPFIPYAVAAVELPEEKMLIQGQVVTGYDYSKLKIGMEMELVIEKLHDDEQGNEVVVWKWKPFNS